MVEEKCKSGAVVKKVGGCDALGNCSVELEGSGKVITLNKPIAGQYICLKSEYSIIEPKSKFGKAMLFLGKVFLGIFGVYFIGGLLGIVK